MPDIAPQNFARPIDPGVTPVNFGSPGGHGSVMSPFDPPWAGLLPKAQTPGEMISAAQFAEQMRTKTRADQGRNALAQIFANPANLDANGLPKPEALAGLAAQGFPKETVEMIGAQADMAKSQADIARSRMMTQEAGQKFLTEEQTRLLGDFEPLVTEYDNNVKTLGPERAKQVGQQHYAELVEKAKTSGGYSPQILQRVNPSFDPERLRANIVGLKGMQDREDKQNQFETRTDYGKTPPVEYRVYKDGRTTDTAGKAPYTPTGVGETKGAEAQLYNIKTADGKEHIGKASPTGGFADASTGERIERVVGARKVGTKDDEGSGQYGKVSQIAIEDPESPGDTKIVPAQQDKKTGQWVTADANRDPLPTPKRIVSTGGAGRQAEAQTMAMINAGNEATGALKNLVELPIGATSGWFKGLTTETPQSLAAAIGRGMAGSVNGRDARSLQISWQGIGRSMATLEAAGRATGLVGLQKQAEALQPQEGDAYTNVLRSYAEIRQIVERSIETIKTSPGVSTDQKKLLTKIEDEAKTTVPWTVHDVNMLETGGKDSVLDFAKKVKVAGSGEKPQADPAGSAPVATAPIPPQNAPAPAAGPQTAAPPAEAFKGKRSLVNLDTGEQWDRRDDGTIVKVR